MAISSPIQDLCWDKDAILQQGNPIIALWLLASRKLISLDTNFANPSFIKWSITGPQLAIGSTKGNLILYNKITKKKLSFMGKHSGQISSGVWSNG